MAYLRGLFDGMQQAKIVEDMKSTFCPLATPDLDQIRLIIEQWVRDNLSHSRADSDMGDSVRCADIDGGLIRARRIWHHRKIPVLALTCTTARQCTKC